MKQSWVGNLILIALVLFMPVIFASDETQFQQDFKLVREQITSRKWDDALAGLNVLLETHANRDYVKAKKAELEDCFRDCLFWRSFKIPKAKDLVSGKLIKYSTSSGFLKIKYDKEGETDFIVKKIKPEDAKKESTEYIFPAAFSGSHTIEINGSQYPDLESLLRPFFILCLENDKFYLLDFGHKKDVLARGRPGEFLFSEGEKQSIIAHDHKNQLDPGKPFHIKVKVESLKITVWSNNKKVFFTKKNRLHYGGFRFFNIPFDTISIQGKVEKSWMQGLKDNSIQKARAEFDSNFDRKKHLPEWLLQNRTTPEEEVDGDYPGSHDRLQDKFFRKGMKYYNSQEFKSGLNYFKELEDSGISEALKNWMLCLFHARLENLSEALVCCRKVNKLAPDFYEARIREADLLVFDDDDKKAIDLLQGLVDEFPEKNEAYYKAAMLHQKNGELQKAKSLVETAIIKGLSSEKIDQLNRRLTKIINGPFIDKTYKSNTKHYRIVSNISRDVCFKAARALEGAYSAYSYYLKRPEELEDVKFPVYIFSGFTGFEEYLKELGMRVVPEIGGMYIPALKQLLIWNLPNEDQMMRVIKHEGFHQYYNRITTNDPPIWLNEGLAVYHENAKRIGGKWRFGAVHLSRRITIRNEKDAFLPLDKFLHLKPEEFYESPDLNYAQAWAFIHFLRHTTEQNKKLFKSIFKASLSEQPVEKWMKQVLRSIDLLELQKAFDAHLEAIILMK